MPNQWWDKINGTKRILFFLFLFGFSKNLFSQSDSISHLPKISFPPAFFRDYPDQPEVISKPRLKAVIIGESITYATGMTSAYFLWYKNSMSGGFHFFDDSKEWLQMDKFGHFSSAYMLSHFSLKAYNWTGMKGIKALNIACLQGLFLMTSLEVFDGFSNSYGFSITDMGFNLLGVGAYYLTKKFPNRITIQPKFSYGKSKFAQYRPDVLGSNFPEKVLKDYNAQTYWLSLNIGNLIQRYDGFIGVLNLSIGYGANGMTGGHENPLVNEQGIAIPEFQRYRQFYLSLDLDLAKIKVKNKFLGKVLKTFNIIKFPFPALEFSRGKVFMNWTSY